MVLTLVEIDSAKQNKVEVGNRPETETSFSAAVRDGRAFTAATPVTTVSSDEYLSVMFSNPSGSGKNALFTARKLGCNKREGERPLSYGFVASPEQAEGAITLTASNRFTGGASSAMEASYWVAPARLNTSPPSQSFPGGFLPNGGSLLNVDEDNGDVSRIAPPGTSFGFYIRGDGSNRADAARVVFTWYEEDA